MVDIWVTMKVGGATYFAQPDALKVMVYSHLEEDLFHILHVTEKIVVHSVTPTCPPLHFRLNLVYNPVKGGRFKLN